MSVNNVSVAGLSSNTEQNIAPLVPLPGRSPLQLTNEPHHMSIVASENAGLGPRELLSVDSWITETLPPTNNSSNSTSIASGAQLSHQQHSKIMNVVVPNVACQPAATKKIRRKPENKPQSQINKCNNEKRRRELENEYIEQLGEFLQINKRDMTACKPDKAAILSEVVKKFRSLLEQRARDNSTQNRSCNKCPPGCSETSCTLHPVQQGEVSSTEPPLPESSVNGHSPEKSAYFEAVQHYIRNVGWALLEINSEGYIEFATENVIDVLHYSRQELCGQSIYSYLPPGDHNKISPILDKNTLSFEWDQDDGGGPSFTQTPKRTVKIRWLLKSPEETIEQRQQRSNRYKDLLIISAPVKDDTDESSSVLCLITLPEDDQTVDTNMSLISRQLTIRIDVEGKIINVDASELKSSAHPPQFTQYATFLTKEVGHDLLQLVHPQDRQKIMHYLQHVMKQGTPDNQNVRYRLLVAPDHYVYTEVSSRYFPSQTGEPDFIMAFHQILDNEIMGGGSGMEASFSGMLPMSSQTMHMKHSSGLGGPLLGSSVMNGGSLSQISPRNNLLNDGPMIQQPPPPFNESFFQSESFDFESFASPTFDIENQLIDSRPESRTSMASVSTPRPSSATAAFSPITAPMCASPLTPFSQPSPASITNNNNTTMTNNNLTSSNSNAASGSNNNSNNNNMSSGFISAGSQGSSFQFSFEDSKEKVQEQLQKIQHQQQQENNTSERLRNLLMKSPSSVDEEQQRKNQILKNLLNADDDKDGSMTHKMNPLSAANRNPIQRPRSVASGSSNDNNMLKQLLNDKSDDDDSNNKQHNSELLKRLQNPTKDEKEMNNNADLDNEALKQRLRFQGGPGSLEINNRKRASDESDDASSGAPRARLSKLQEKNKMLASLLAVPCRPITNYTAGLPTVRIMPDIPMHKQQMASPQGSLGGDAKPSTTPNPNIPNNKNMNNNNSVTKNNNLKNPPQKFRQQNVSRQHSLPAGNALKQMGENIYLQQLQSHQLVSINRAVNSQSSFDGSDSQPYVSSSPAIIQAPASSSSSSTIVVAQSSDSVIDPELNDILDNLFEEGSYNEESNMNFMPNVNNNNAQLKQQEEMAQINKIQMSLMECEDEANFSGSPPAYPLHAQNARNLQQQTFSQPPPGYNQRNIRMPQMTINSSSNSLVTNSNAANSQKASSNALLIERIRMQQQQQQQQIILEQKQRLLQQQQNQQIVVTAGADQLCLPTTGVQSIDSLLNNTVAPNVTLTSRGKMVPDSQQLSPNFAQSLMHQQLSPNQQRSNNTSFTSQTNQNFQQNNFNANGNQRLSPQQQQINQQLINSFQGGNNTNVTNTSQLSPRQPPFNLQSNAQVQATQANWNSQQPNNNPIRLNLQQSNPMLNAQLSQQNVNNFANQRQLIAQRQRSLNSPGTPVSRQNSFSQDSFPEPPSPSGSAQQQQQQQYPNTIFNQQQLRLQRQQSVPQATQHLPGSPRPYGPGLDGPSGYMLYNSPGGGTDFYRVNQTGGQNNGLNSQMVRQSLRTVVSGRQTVGNGNGANNNNGIRRNMSSPMDQLGPNGGGLDNGNPNNNTILINPQQQQQQQQQQTQQQMINTDMDSSMRFNFDMQQGTNIETKLTVPPTTQCWSGGNSNNSRISLEERTGDQNSKNSSLLLQKLLSD